MNIYRAWTQSITIDEAFTYNIFLDGPLQNIFTTYDANNHVLNTILCKLSIGLFGRSELAMRIPSLLGGLLYMVTILRLCRQVFGDGWFTFLSFALMCMNPAVLDHMSAARGYGLALAFFFWAVACATATAAPRLEKVGLCLALSVASNLTFVFPGAALALVVTMRLARQGKARAAVDRLIVPGIVVAFAIVILPLLHIDKDSFYVGAQTLGASMESIVSIGWEHHAGQPLSLTSLLPELLRGSKILIPTVLLVAAGMCLRKGASPMLILTTGSLIGSALLLITGHWAFHLLYPSRRTGLYWIPLFLLTCLLLLWTLLEKKRLAAAPFLVVALVCLAQFVSQLCVRHYSEWQVDASTKRIVQRIRVYHALQPDATARVGTATWQLEPGLNFYRRLYRLDWMQPVDRDRWDGPRDYYVALPAEARLLEKLSLTKVYEDRQTHAILAVPAR